MIWNFQWYAEHPCPQCGARIVLESDCPGYPRYDKDGERHIMVCYPTHHCGNALYGQCERWDDDEAGPCDWWCRYPNNRNTTEWYAELKRDVPMADPPGWFKALADWTPGGGEDEA